MSKASERARTLFESQETLDGGDYTLSVGSVLGRSWEDHFPTERRTAPVTVCVAAICQWNESNSDLWIPMVVGAADRMLTASDIQYEPPQCKIFALTKKFAVMIAGDAAAHSRIVTAVTQRLTTVENPTVLDAAEAYALDLAEYRKRNAERLILGPLGLSFQEFLAHQDQLAPQVVERVTSRLQRFRVDAEAIVAGVDTAPHIYVVRDPGTVTCHDLIGFAAIGIGASHAASQFMFSRYSNVWSFPQALFLVFSAKKRAEVAPGVGIESDLFYADKDRHWVIDRDNDPTNLLDQMLSLYTESIQRAEKATKTAEKQVVDYVRQLNEKAKQRCGSTSSQTNGPGVTPSGDHTSTWRL